MPKVAVFGTEICVCASPEGETHADRRGIIPPAPLKHPSSRFFKINLDFGPDFRRGWWVGPDVGLTSPLPSESSLGGRAEAFLRLFALPFGTSHQFPGPVTPLPTWGFEKLSSKLKIFGHVSESSPATNAIRKRPGGSAARRSGLLRCASRYLFLARKSFPFNPCRPRVKIGSRG